ncbi:hypothetical protein Bpla01_58740 [Burkholderia plantarii]|nr:hypothetical protein Bpla01_58740 [Burkholderia plantarii]
MSFRHWRAAFEGMAAGRRPVFVPDRRHQAAGDDGPWTPKLAGHGAGERRGTMAARGRCHDFTVSRDASAVFRRRFAGHRDRPRFRVRSGNGHRMKRPPLSRPA